MSRKQITIQDIANDTGVSKTTVSRYLNGKFEFMSEETRNKIASAIERTGYRPNCMANSLKTDRSGLIGLVMSNVMSSQTPMLLGSICDTCVNHGKKVIVVNSENDPEKEKELVYDLLAQRVDGLLVMSGYNYDFYHELDQTELPIVLVDRVPRDADMDCVAIDHEESTKKVVSDLLNRGYRRVILLKRPHRNPNNTPRIREMAALATCEERFGNDSACTSINIAFNKYDTDSTDAFQELTELLKRFYAESADVPTAIFVVEATIMNAVACSYYRVGLQLSKQFTIAGYCEWNMGGLIVPQISTIEQPLKQLGETAAELLMSRLKKKDEDENRIHVMNYLGCRIHLAEFE